MTAAVQSSSRAAQIVEAIGRGVNTAPALAALFKTDVPRISVELQRLKDMVAIRPKGTAPTSKGRPPVRYEVVRGAK